MTLSRAVRTIVVLAAILLGVAESCMGAPYRARRRVFGPDHPVARSHISNVQQDPVGLMWFATWDGLLRFDGINSHTFRPIALSDGAITSNRIYNIRFDKAGKVWCVSSDNRLFTFDTRTQHFEDLLSADSLLSEMRVKKLMPLRNGAVWVLLRDGRAVRYGEEGRTISPVEGVRIVTLHEESDEWVIGDREARNHTRGYSVPGKWFNVFIINGRTVLVGRDGSVAEFDRHGAAGRRFDPVGIPGVKVNHTLRVADCVVIATDKGIFGVNLLDGRMFRYSTHPATYLYKDSRGRAWGFGEPGRVTLMDDPDEGGATELHTLPAPLPKESKEQHMAMEDAAGNVIVMPRGGILSRYNPVTMQLDPCEVSDAAGNIGHYAPAEIKKSLVDHDRNLWVFHQGGADCITFMPEGFEYLPNPSGAEIRALMADRHGRLWTADRDNLLRVGEEGWVSPSGNLSTTPVPLTSRPVYVLGQAPDGSVWAGTKGDGLYILTPRTAARGFDIAHYLHDSADPHSLRSDTIYDIRFVRDGSAWLGSYGGGLSQAHPAAGGMNFVQTPGQPAGMKIRSIAEVGKALVLSTAEGLTVLDLADGRFRTATYSSAPDGLNGNDIMGFATVADSAYVCVFGGGLSRLPVSTLTDAALSFTPIPLSAEATSSRMKGMACDGRRLWITGEHSLTGYDTASGRCINFGSDSFGAQFALTEAAPAIMGDTIYIGASSGVLRFIPSLLNFSPKDRRIALTGIRFRNTADITPLDNPDTLTIDPAHRSFTLCISAMEYDGTDTSRFRYRLEGEDEWSYTEGPQPTVAFDNINPGEHTLLIEVTDRDGNWQAAGRRLVLDVTPRTTERLWFRLLMALLAAGFVAALIWNIIYLRRMRTLTQNKYSLLMSADRIHADFGMTSGATPPRDEKETRQREFMEKCTSFVIENVSNPDLVVEDLARHLGMSRTALYGMMREVAGVTPVDFIKQVRIKQALRLLDRGGKSISEVAYAVGFSDPKYFSRCFKAEMDMTPTQYVDWRHVQENQ